MRDLFPVTVLGNKKIASNSWLLSFKRNFEFTAGHVIGISLNNNLEPRLYSIASGIQQNEVWILYTVKPDGLLTPPLSSLKPGEKIFITKPFGNFICDADEAIWISTGTGIAPFASMFFSGQHKNKSLIQGSRDFEALYFYDQFKKEMGGNYHPCCSKQNHKDCFHGRVTDYLSQQEIIKTDIPYYLCGIAEMVVDTRDLLIERGVPFNNIMAEIFF
jgi:ferredoxin--NADP+ reductase